MSEHRHVAIIGAGLAGLTMARILAVNNVSATVYESEASPAARPQGGVLDMHEDSGQAALRAAELYDEFRAAVHEGGEATRILDKAGHVWMAEEDEGTSNRPEINRMDLRQILLDSIPGEMIRWGARIVRAEEAGDGRHQVVLQNGDTVTADLLVGADGAWSRVRPLVSAARPAYSGISFVEAHIRDADHSSPRSAEVVGAGILFALDDEKGILAHRDTAGDLHIYYALKVTEDWSGSVTELGDIGAVRRLLLDSFADWDGALRGLITDAVPPFVPRPIFALPVGHRWAQVPGVTLIGDAAHLMSPFAGEGANLAMRDGAELAQAIIDHPDSLTAAIARYEEAMFPRSEAMARESAGNLTMCFLPDAAHRLVDQMAQYTAQAQPDMAERLY